VAYVNAKEIIPCEPGIRGLGEPIEIPTGGRTFTECANFVAEYPGLDPVELSFYMVRAFDEDGCLTRQYFCPGADCSGCSGNDCLPSNSPCTEIVPEDPDPELDEVLATSFLRTCEDENLNVYGHSPFYGYKTTSGGRTYKVCIDLATGQRVNKVNCPKLGINP
jgi:hypothetical protein